MRWRWWSMGVAVAILLAGCGGSPAIVAPGEHEAAPLLEAVIPLEDGTATPTSTPVPTPTPKPSSKDSILVPAPAGPGPLRLSNAPVPFVEASAVLIMDGASGAVLWERDAETALAPASLTKIATAVVALESGEDLDRWVQVDVDSRAMPGSTVMGLQPGDWFKLRDLLYGLMLPSGNDAALAIARAVAGSDAAFVARMNALTTRLGLVESRFANPHGLGSTGHLTSAYDLAVLTRYAMTVPGFPELASARSWVAKGSPRDIVMYNLNTVLGNYAGADGVKVGYTRRAGNTIVASAVRDGHRVFVVLLNAPNSKTDAPRLLDWAFANHTWPES